MCKIKLLKRKLNSFQIIILGFAGVIFLGTLLLMLPVSSKSGVATSFINSLFTATSAVCVTGLVIKDTATYWSYFGQTIIILLIQLGGLGIISVAAFLTMLSGRKISLMQRSTLQDAISAQQVGGVVRITKFVFKIAFLIEFIGALLMLPVFLKNYGTKGIWISFFHSISAFCNAGFDLMGDKSGNFSSLTFFSGNIFISGVISALIVVGGIGFLTWDDFVQNKLKLKKYRMQSKLILLTTGILIIVPAIWFFFSEFSKLGFTERFCQSFFQAITPRTAGFNTADLTKLTGVGKALIVVLMLIGGSPGSTAGGMKTTTAAVLFANMFATFKKKKSVKCFGRRMDDEVIKTASVILMLYLVLFLISGFVISAVEKLPIGICLFETASAIGTVGLTLGITPLLGVISKLVLIALMFFGRVGGLTLIFAAVSKKTVDISQYPVEKITVG